MSARARCQGCGAKLPSVDTVCARCEATLANDPPAAEGKYVCPHCSGRFAKPAQVPWPPKSPWWRPTMVSLQCPHCDTPLRDRRQPRIHRGFTPLVLGAMLAIQFFVADRTLRSLLGFLVLICILAYLYLRTERGVVERDRYTTGSSQRWAIGITDPADAPSRHRGPPPR